MFHVKHYSVIANFYRENSTSAIEGISFESLIDLIYSSSNKKIIFYNDSDYNKIVDNFTETSVFGLETINCYKTVHRWLCGGSSRGNLIKCVTTTCTGSMGAIGCTEGMLKKWLIAETKHTLGSWGGELGSDFS